MECGTFSEKHDFLQHHPEQDWSSTAQPRNRLKAARISVLSTAACLICLATLQSWLSAPIFKHHEPTDTSSQVQAFPEERNDPDFSWHMIVPSAKLEYHSCFGDYECARLEVPMDWYRESDGGSKVAIAITRLPAKVAVTDPRYGGPVLTNPGGPGGSGVSQVLRNGRATQTIVDSALHPNSTLSDHTHKYHDIIGFDPRGISRTTPGIQCFPDSLSREAWAMQNEALGLLGSSEDSFLRNWYRSRALAEGCSAATTVSIDGNEPIGEHVNTSPVARDMLEIVERHAEWVERQGKLAQTTHDMTFGYDESRTIARRTKWEKGQEKIKYWGNSYGTIVGQTFASMFPDRVDRLILDGVCDTRDYYFGAWFSNLKDSDKILDRFFQYCFDAGPERCSFHDSDGPATMKKIYDDLLLDIFSYPRPVPMSSTRGPDVITWSDVKSMVRLGMYQPLIFMPMVADLLTDVSRGNGSLFADFKHMENTPSCPSMECRAAGPYSRECNAAGDNGADATMAILCTDAVGLGEIDESAFQQYWHSLQNQSHVLGDWWAMTRLSCVGWRARAKHRFAGPFTGNTSHPILFIGNTLDPVTPLDNARRMTENFPGSSMLQQNSEGHTSWSSPSICTAKAARAYFQSGVLPENGTVCEVERKPFDNVFSGVEDMDESDRALIDALDMLQASCMDLTLRRSMGIF